MDSKQPHLKHLPTPAEVEETLAEISLIDGQIEAFRAQISALQKQRAHKMSFIAPFRRLPSELLYAIMEEYMHQGGDPRVLAQTCSTFLDAIHGMKSLWSSIYFGNPVYKMGSLDTGNYWETWSRGTRKCTNLDYFAVLLERAAPAPLSIVMPEHYVIPDVLKVLEPFSAFVHRFKIEEGPPIDTEDELIERLSHLTFPNLQYLEMKSRPAPYTFYLLELGNRSRQDIPAFELRLACDRASLDILQHGLFQRITALSLFLEDDIPPLASVIILPHLEKLSLARCHTFFGCTVMPKLRHLEIYGIPVELKFIPTHIEVLHLTACCLFNRASQPLSLDMLKCLVIIKTSIEQSLSACFRMSSLEEFVFSNPGVFIGDDPLDVVNIDPETFLGPVPSLKRLWLDDLQPDLMLVHFFPPSLLALRMTRCKAWISPQDEPLLPHLEDLIFQDCNFRRINSFLDLLRESRRKFATTPINDTRICYGDPTGWSRYPFQTSPIFDMDEY